MKRALKASCKMLILKVVQNGLLTGYPSDVDKENVKKKLDKIFE